MVYIDLPDSPADRRLSFFLAMEEYVARHVDTPECFFMWQVAPTVIFGRNQSMEQEVNEDYCRSHGIQMYRRKSGGGCVYADRDNVMLSMITSGDDIQFAFHQFIGAVTLALRKMGIEAVGTSHNDVMIGDRKVSGTAMYHLPGRNIVHSTLLYDTNMEHMVHAITPTQEKLRSKGIQSVRQRITLLKDHTTLSLDEVKALIRHTICTDTQVLTDRQVAEVEQLEQTYLDADFIRLL